jgi:folate-binding protein YgfZ
MKPMTEVAAPGPRTSTARAGVALADRPDLATVQLDGADVLRYLHTVSSQHTADRSVGDSATGLLLSPKGKVEFAFRLAVQPGGALLDTDADAAEGLAERLRRFIFRFDVQVAEPVPGGFTLLGPEASALAGSLGLPVPAAPGQAGLGAGLVVHLTKLGVDVVGPGAAAVRNLLPADLPTVGAELLDALRIEAGLARWGRELTDDVIAEEAGLLGSHVHLDKGCYPGQETVARVHNLGHVQRRLAGLVCDGEVPPPFRSDLVTEDGARAGQVRGGAVHPDLGPIALAYVRRTVAPGQRVLAGEQAATVVDLPFARAAS